VVWMPFPMMKPFLVRRLSRSSQAVATIHGCTLEIYPDETRPKAHRLPVPQNTIMETLSSHCNRLHFPDGFTCLLVWHRTFYRWHRDA
jgi:hypothetical protein